MPARVPELDTSGMDVTNAIAKGVQARQGLASAKSQEMTNTLMEEEMTPAAKARRNEIRKQKHKADMLEMNAKMYEHGREGLKWAVDAVNAGEPGAYAAFRQHMVRTFGIPPESFPKFSAFHDRRPDLNSPTGWKEQFNNYRFNQWAEHALKTGDEVFAAGDKSKDMFEQKTLYGPDGKQMSVGIKIGETYEVPEGWSFDNPKDEKSDVPKPMTPAQQATNERADENQIFNWEKTLGKEDKDGNISNELVDPNSTQIQLYNKKAREKGLPLYVWKEDAYQVPAEEEDPGTGLVSLPKKVWNAASEFVMGKDTPETKPTGGWVKQPGKKPSKVAKVTGEENIQKAIDQANEAINNGADPEAVRKRLKDMGIEVE